VLAGAGLTALRPRALVAIGLVATAWIGLQDQQNIRARASHEWTDEKAAARIIAKGYQPGDGVVPVRGKQDYMMLNFALEYYLPRNVQPKDVFQAKSPEQRKDLYATDCADPAACAAGVNRIWVVTYGGWGDGPFKGLSDDETQVLQTQYTTEEVQHVQGLTIALVERK
jgi:mannosyltransferase